jgi:hypothetical protein
MKKILFFASALAGLFLAGSCQREEFAPVEENGVVTFEVAIPELATKSYDAEGKNINDLVYAVYSTKAETLEAAQTANDLKFFYAVNEKLAENGQSSFVENKSIVTLELLNDQNYLILFWAQNNDAWVNKQGGSIDLFNVTYPTSMAANNELLEAFSGVSFIKNVKGARKENVTLRRPFAQINLATTMPKAFTATLSQSDMSVAKAAESFNVATQAASDTPKTVSFTAANVPVADFKEGYTYAGANYIFANGDVDVSYKIYTSHGDVQNTIASVPVAKNYRTNIIGNLLTSDVDYNVTLEKDWDGNEDMQIGVKIGNVTYNTLAEAYEAANDGDELVVVGHLVLSEQVVIKKDITLNINGNEITTTYDAENEKHLYALNNKANLTIKNGTIKSRGIYNYGTLTLEAGAVIDACDANGGYAIYNFGTFVMKEGSEVKTTYEDDHLVDKGGYDATTIRNENGGTVTINGGEVNNISDYTSAIDNQAGGEVVVNGGVITSIHSTVSNYGTLTINGGSFTCNGIEGITAHVLVAWNGSQTTINGGILNGKDNYNGFNVDADAGATVYVKGGEFKPVHSGSLYGDGTIIVSGGVFFDEIPTSRLADGCELEQLQDGYWKVEGKGWYKDANGNYHIEGAKGWLWMADQNDTFFGSKTIYLENDIDFSGVDMRVTRMFTPEYSATFDGQNHTISNVWMNSGYKQNNQALFDGLMTVKNLTVVNTHVYGMSQVGIIGANIFGTVENCHVKGCRSYGYEHHVGGIVGLHSWGEIKNCSVENTKIECYYYGAVGAIAGAMNEVSRNITGCSVKGCQLIKEGAEGVYPDWDPRFGIAVGYAYAPGTYKFNVEVENNTIKGVASEQMYGEVAAGSTVTVNDVQQN